MLVSAGALSSRLSFPPVQSNGYATMASKRVPFCPKVFLYRHALPSAAQMLLRWETQERFNPELE
ncbi:hypothetical protein BGW80DRAFT_1303245 [Lactifluus volemus]|nr:hypothetical protein BGW80DRAFT_1303245 [Lactifluus volemus]